jgi:hypothetical protein
MPFMLCLTHDWLKSHAYALLDPMEKRLLLLDGTKLRLCIFTAFFLQT